MEITFLGTAAADFSEKLLNEYKNKFDLNARRSSSIIIDKKYLIDCGPHTLNSLSIANINISSIECIFITHLHSDHVNWENIDLISKAKPNPLTVFVLNNSSLPHLNNVNFVKMKYETKCEINKKFYVTGLKANHDESSCPQHLLIECENKKIFYGCDGAWLTNSTYYYLKNINLDLAIFDCTCGSSINEFRLFEHNSIDMVKLMIPALKNWKTLREDSIVYVSHIAPSLHKPHDDIVNQFKKNNINVAFDGLTINI